MGELPPTLKINHLNNRSGIEQTLLTNKAKFHTSFRDNFNSTKLNRLKKRKSSQAFEKCHKEDDSVVKKTRSNVDATHSMCKKQCFLCYDPSSNTDLVAASTFSLDENIKQCAKKLQDTKLLAKQCWRCCIIRSQISQEMFSKSLQ